MSSKRGGLASGFAGKQNPANPHTPREWVPRLRRPPHCHGLRGVARRGDAEAGRGRARARVSGLGRRRRGPTRVPSASRPRGSAERLRLSPCSGPWVWSPPRPQAVSPGGDSNPGEWSTNGQGARGGSFLGEDRGGGGGHRPRGLPRVCVGGQTPCRGPSSACRPPRDTREARSGRPSLPPVRRPSCRLSNKEQQARNGAAC